MASYVFYPGNGSQTDWAVPFPYLSADHVKVYSGGVAQPFTWINSALLRVTPAVPAGTVLLVKRETQKTPMTVFENTNNLTAENLTLAETQALFIAEEASDRANMSIALDEATGHFDFSARRATNAANPVNAQDLVTKQWAETAQTAQLAQAIAAKDAAINARATTEAARDVAIEKAQSAADDADFAHESIATVTGIASTVAADRATVASDKAVIAAYRNDTAADRVATAADRVATGQDRVAVAADKATVAADKATVAADKADVNTAKVAAQAAQAAAEAARDQAKQIVGTPAASGVTFAPASSITSTNVQDAIVEALADATETANTKLAKNQNLADVLDKAAARSNLGLGSAATLSAGNTAGNVVQLDAAGRLPNVDGSQLTGIQGIPVGTTILVNGGTAPPGFLKENGAVLSRAAYPALWAYAQTYCRVVSEADWANGNWGTFSYGDGSTTFRIPDTRGEFIRNWDDGRGADSGRPLGSFQGQDIQSHSHPYALPAGYNYGYANAWPLRAHPSASDTTWTGAAGGSETRPRNVSKMACIKY